MHRSPLYALALLAVGCAAPSAEEADTTLDGDRVPVSGDHATRIVLALVNSASFETLDVDADLDRRAAENIVAHRQGADGLDGTADDDRFDDIAELDGVSYVGASALEKLHAYALTVYGAEDEAVEIHGIAEGSEEAAAILSLANTLDQDTLDDDVGLDSRAAANIVAARAEASIATLAELDAVGYVGASAFEALLAYAIETGALADGCEDGKVWVEGVGTYASPAAAASTVAPGMTVYLCGGTYTGLVDIGVPMHFVGVEGAEATVLDGGGLGTTVMVRAAGVTISGVTIRGGNGAISGALDGGGVHVVSGATGFSLSDAIVEDNSADRGGGLQLLADATLERVTVRGNEASGVYGTGGGVLVSNADLTAIDTVVEDNVADYGGGYHLSSTASDAVLRGGAVRGNLSASLGGGVRTFGDLTATDTVFEGNEGSKGGAIYQGSDGAVVLDGARVIGNTSTEGGVYALSRGALTSIDVDWGTGADENAPYDLTVREGDSNWRTYATAPSFSCDNDYAAGITCTY